MSQETATEGSRRAVRSDRLRNRERILDAARAVFSADGIDAPLDRIVKTAGVGPATLYRHFPTRADLWTAVLADPLGRHLTAIDDALAQDDAWEGFSQFVLAICALDADPRGYPGLLNMRFDDAPELQELRRRIQLGITRIFARARQAGAIRADVTHQDLFFVTLSNAHVVEATKDIAPQAWRRNVAFYLDAFRPDQRRELPEPPLTVQQLAAAVTRRARAPKPRPSTPSTPRQTVH